MRYEVVVEESVQWAEFGMGLISTCRESVAGQYLRHGKLISLYYIAMARYSC